MLGKLAFWTAVSVLLSFEPANGAHTNGGETVDSSALDRTQADGTAVGSGGEISAKERIRQGYQYRGDGPHLPLYLPKTILERELEEYAELLGLSEAQRIEFRRLHERYLEDDYRLRKDRVEPLHERTAGLLKRDLRLLSIEAAEERAAILHERDAILPALAAIENRLFDELQPSLADAQVELLQRAKMLRTRRRIHPDHCSYPAGALDLTELLRQMDRAGIDLTPNDPVAYDEILLAYETTVTPLFVERQHRKIHGVLAHNTLLRARRRALLDYADQTGADVREEVEALSSRAERYRRDHVRVAEQINRINHRYVELIAAALPTETAKAFRRRFLECTYPILFPDAFHPDSIFEAAGALESLTIEERESVDDCRRLYLDQEDELKRQMIAVYLDWKERVIVRSGYDPAKWEIYKAKMKRLRSAREAVADLAVEVLREELAPEHVDAINGAIAAWAEQCAAYVEDRERWQRLNPHMDWPLPYD